MIGKVPSKKEIVFSTRDLPTIPDLHLRILKLMEDGGYAVDGLCALIERDQVISSRVIRLVNSPYYNLGSDISSVKKAIVLLGTNLIRGLVLSTSLFQISDALLPGMWDHSYCCSVVAVSVAERLNMRHIEDIMTGALLHDLGKIIIRKQLPEESRITDQLILSDCLPMIDAEKRVIGVTHCDAGVFLADSWNFPSLIRDIIAFHHLPSQCLLHKKETAVVHFSDVIVKGIGISYSGDIFVPRVDEDGLKSLSLSEEEIPDILAGVLDMAESNPAFSKYLNGRMHA